MLPKKYSFLETIGELPRIVDNALQFIGIKEFPGRVSNNPVIMNMAKQMNVTNIYHNDEVAWCALFMNYILEISDKPMPYKDYEILRAASFIGEGNTQPDPWGFPVSIEDICLGDIVVFKRPEGYHVGIAIAISKDKNGKMKSIHTLGGNQSNSVTIAEIPAFRLAGIRRYYSVGKPDSAKQYVIDSSNNFSTNEA